MVEQDYMERWRVVVSNSKLRFTVPGERKSGSERALCNMDYMERWRVVVTTGSPLLGQECASQ